MYEESSFYLVLQIGTKSLDPFYCRDFSWHLFGTDMRIDVLDMKKLLMLHVRARVCVCVL